MNREEILDQHAYVCRDCIFLIANGDGPNYEDDYPGKTEAEYAAMRADYYARIEENTHGCEITLGWVREEHDCATNFTVTPIMRESGAIVQRAENAREYRAETMAEAVAEAESDATTRWTGEIIGFHVLAHDLETEGDRGGECDCETLSFGHENCAYCGDDYVGEWYAATVWKTVED